MLKNSLIFVSLLIVIIIIVFFITAKPGTKITSQNILKGTMNLITQKDPSKIKKDCAEGKILVNDKCIAKLTDEYCAKKHSIYFEASDDSTQCVKKSEEDIKNSCKETESYFEGMCKMKKTKEDCKESSFLEPDPTVNDTKCREVSEEKKK